MSHRQEAAELLKKVLEDFEHIVKQVHRNRRIYAREVEDLEKSIDAWWRHHKEE